MDRILKRESLISRSLVLGVALLTLVILFIQYQWFDQAASSKMDESRRELRKAVFQTVIREYQRYNRVLDTLRLRPLDSLSADEAVSALTLLASHFGPDGAEPGFLGGLLVVTAKDGKVLAAAGEAARSESAPGWLKSFQSDGWAKEHPGRLALLRAPGTGPSSLPVLSGTASGGSLAFFLVLDQTAFFQTWVIPSVRETWPGYRVDLVSINNPVLPDGPDQASKNDYRFNPLTALLGFGNSGFDRIQLLVPDLQDEVFKFRGPADNTQTVSRQPPSDQTDFRRQAHLALQLSDESGSHLGRVETEIALSWAGSTFLMLLVGAGFAVVLLQARKLASLRRQEREFVAGITHELRTPLTVIQAAGDNLASGRLGPERTGEYGQLILDQSKRLGRMIEEVIEFSRVEGGHATQPDWQTLDRDEAVRSLRERLDPLAASRGIQLVWDTLGLPEQFTADAESLRLVVENLVANAIHHAYAEPEGKEIRCILRFSLPDRILVTVEDDGRGILPAEARRVFEPFYRDSVSRSRQEKGSGLGLYLALRRLEAAGGDISLESPWRRLDGAKRPGCRFQAVLPIPPEKKHTPS